jgi:hypothetical protein
LTGTATDNEQNAFFSGETDITEQMGFSALLIPERGWEAAIATH